MVTENFLDYLRYEKRYSDHTIKAYQTDLNQFESYLSEAFELTKETTASHGIIRSWIVSLMNDGLSSRSVNRKISTLKTYYKFLKREGDISENPMQKIQSPKTSKRLPVFVEEDKMKALLEEIDFDAGFEGVRDKLIFELLYATGMRVSELVNVKLLDVQLKEQTIKVLGKRNKERLIPITPFTASEIRKYLEVKNGLDVCQSGDYLLVRESGEKLYREFVYRIVNRYLGEVTTANKKSPHVLRHTFATHMLNNGADLNSIKELLGHANLSATQVYTHNTIEKLKSIHKQAHPKG